MSTEKWAQVGGGRDSISSVTLTPIHTHTHRLPIQLRETRASNEIVFHSVEYQTKRQRAATFQLPLCTVYEDEIRYWLTGKYFI